MSTLLASYLAKSRGSNEPENSNLRSRELDTFIREMEAWMMDKGMQVVIIIHDTHLCIAVLGHIVGPEFDPQITKFRERYEDIIRTAGENTDTAGFDHQHPRAAQNAPNHQPRGPVQVHDNPKASEKV
jgi:SMODS and SLOG-associating 2TM effector domain